MLTLTIRAPLSASDASLFSVTKPTTKNKNNSPPTFSPCRYQGDPCLPVRVPSHREGDGSRSLGCIQNLQDVRTVGVESRFREMRVSRRMPFPLPCSFTPQADESPSPPSACKSYYHMACVNPPLIAKPAKGYSWVCLPCAHRRAGLSPALSNGSHVPTVGRPPNGKGKGKEKEKWVEPAYDRPDAFYRGWNFRYFG